VGWAAVALARCGAVVVKRVARARWPPWTVFGQIYVECRSRMRLATRDPRAVRGAPRRGLAPPLVGWVAASSRVPARRHVLRHCAKPPRPSPSSECCAG